MMIGGIFMKKMIGIFVFAVILTGCGNEESTDSSEGSNNSVEDNSSESSDSSAAYNFIGSSENWDVIYEVDILNDNAEESTGTIEYMGDEDPPETIDYEIDYSGGAGSETGRNLYDGVASMGTTSCAGCAVTQEDEEIEVEINWEGRTENLILTTDE